MKVPSRVLGLATCVRHVMENVAVSIDSNVHPDTLQGACALASWTLSELLQRHGVRATFVEGGYYDPERAPDPDPHCWVSLGRGLIVDLTATQFGVEDRVYVPSSRVKYLPSRYGRPAFEWVLRQGWHEDVELPLSQLVVELYRLTREAS